VHCLDTDKIAVRAGKFRRAHIRIGRSRRLEEAARGIPAGQALAVGNHAAKYRPNYRA
jgi:hypothetical protein